MGIKEDVIKDIENEIYKNNITIENGNRIFLSYVKDNLFCLFTVNSKYPFFSEDTPEKMNVFFKTLGNMLVSTNGDGSGCFDYESLPSNSSIKNKLSRYFSTGNINFMLISYKKKNIKLLSFFTFAGDFIWTVCTHFKERNNGYMGILFKHFISLFKSGELNKMSLIKNKYLSLYLLRSNPLFENTQKFYEENGFKIDQDIEDKLIMKIEL